VGLEQDWWQEGRLQGEAWRGQGLHDSKGGHVQHLCSPYRTFTAYDGGLPIMLPAMFALLQQIKASCQNTFTAAFGTPKIQPATSSPLSSGRSTLVGGKNAPMSYRNQPPGSPLEGCILRSSGRPCTSVLTGTMPKAYKVIK
jgi:hypothetical protein